MLPIPEILTLLGINFAITLAGFVILWRIGCVLRDVSFVDAWWALGLALMAVTTFFQAKGSSARMLLILGLTCLWGLRLGLYLLWRWRSYGPDRRYVKMLARAEETKGWRFPKASWRLVFMTQAPILWTVSLPVQLGQMSPTPVGIGPLGWAAAGLVVFGIAFESLADWQLVRFKADPANTGKVFDRGLWRFTRHPNYFGDLCTWFGLSGIAAETQIGLFGLVGPLLLLVLFLKYSGGTSYETRLTHHRPGYADYIARTSPLIPWPPRRPASRDTPSAA